MLIKTTHEQDQKIFLWYRKIVRDHHAEGCKPPGFELVVELGHPSHIDVEAVAVCGFSHLDLRPVEVILE